MNVLYITINEKGVERVSIVAKNETEETKILAIYAKIRADISRLDKKIAGGK